MQIVMHFIGPRLLGACKKSRRCVEAEFEWPFVGRTCVSVTKLKQGKGYRYTDDGNDQGAMVIDRTYPNLERLFYEHELGNIPGFSELVRAL